MRLNFLIVVPCFVLAACTSSARPTQAPRVITVVVTSAVTVSQPTPIPVNTPLPTWTTPPSEMWVCADLAFGYAAPDKRASIVFQVSQQDGWKVRVLERASPWYAVRVGNKLAFMEESSLCSQAPAPTLSTPTPTGSVPAAGLTAVPKVTNRPPAAPPTQAPPTLPPPTRPPSRPTSSSCISWQDAEAHMNETTCVSGIVYSTYDSGKAFFINFSNSRSAFYAVAFPPLKWEGLKGRCVEISGKIVPYQGRAEIIINSVSQLKFCP